jgi:undecaprenyl-diphosphatase
MGVRYLPDQAGFLGALLSPLLAWSLSLVLKRVIARKRPSADIDGYEPVLHVPSQHSFPSSHAASSFSFFVALLFIGHPLAIVVGIWAILVSFSRLYLGVHFVTDVLGGALLGAVCALAVQGLPVLIG